MVSYEPTWSQQENHDLSQVHRLGLPVAFLDGAQKTLPARLRWGLPQSRERRAQSNETSMTAANDLAVRRALELAGVEFIDENGGGPGVRLRKRQQKKG